MCGTGVLISLEKVVSDLELSVNVRELYTAVREIVAQGRNDAPLLARRRLILGVQKTGVEHLALFVRYFDIAGNFHLHDPVEKWTRNSAKSFHRNEAEVAFFGTGGFCGVESTVAR